MKFRFIPEIAIADVAFEARGKTLEELFGNCALATEEIMVDTKKVRPKIKKQIKLEAENLDNLLFDFLSELLFYKDAEGLLFSRFKIKVVETKKKNKKYVLAAEVAGEKRDPARHDLRADVKAITLHMWVLKKEKGGWYARIIEDI